MIKHLHCLYPRFHGIIIHNPWIHSNTDVSDGNYAVGLFSGSIFIEHKAEYGITRSFIEL